MGGRELKEDLQKLQKLTGESEDFCFKAFIYCNRDIQKAAEYINSLNGSFLNLEEWVK